MAAAVLGIAGCGTITKTPAPASARPAALASTKAAPSPSNSLSGPVGTVYTVTDQSGNKMTVAFTKVIDPAQGADQFTTPGNGNRFVGAVFTINGISGTLSDDANNDATLIGSNGQTYTADFDSIAAYTNFNNGEYNVSAGENSVGAVTFQVPLTVKVTKIEWSANGGFGGAPAEWLVPAAARPALPARPLPGRQGLYNDITLRDYATLAAARDPARVADTPASPPGRNRRRRHKPGQASRCRRTSDR